MESYVPGRNAWENEALLFRLAGLDLIAWYGWAFSDRVSGEGVTRRMVEATL
jgi:hypothetical protein